MSLTRVKAGSTAAPEGIQSGSPMPSAPISAEPAYNLSGSNLESVSKVGPPASQGAANRLSGGYGPAGDAGAPGRGEALVVDDGHSPMSGAMSPPAQPHLPSPNFAARAVPHVVKGASDVQRLTRALAPLQAIPKPAGPRFT
jgi:hypothetical protein